MFKSRFRFRVRCTTEFKVELGIRLVYETTADKSSQEYNYVVLPPQSAENIEGITTNTFT